MLEIVDGEIAAVLAVGGDVGHQGDDDAGDHQHGTDDLQDPFAVAATGFHLECVDLGTELVDTGLIGHGVTSSVADGGDAWPM